MDLGDRLLVERFRLAVERQHQLSGVARRAFAVYAVLAAVTALAAVILVAARESLALDVSVLPDLLDLLASVVSFLAVVAVVQIVIAVFRRRAWRRLELEIDPTGPWRSAARPIAEVVYLVIIVGSLIAAWQLSGEFGRELARAAGGLAALR